MARRRIYRLQTGKELTLAFKDFVSDFKDAKLIGWVEAAAWYMAEVIRGNAPGRLKQVIVSWKFKKQYPSQPAAFVAVDRNKKVADGKGIMRMIGRVAHLVERGHAGPGSQLFDAAVRRSSFRDILSGRVKKPRGGPAPAYPFFLPGVKSARNASRKIIEMGIKQVIKELTV